MTSDKPTASDPKTPEKTAVETVLKKAAPVAKPAPKKAALAEAKPVAKSAAEAFAVPKTTSAPAQTKIAAKAKPTATKAKVAAPETEKPATKTQPQKTPAAKAAQTNADVTKASKPAVSVQTKPQAIKPAAPKTPNPTVAAPAPKKSAPKARKRKPLPPAIQGIRKRLPHFIQLMRLDKPIGILLLLWPTLWALWLAAKGFPSWKNLAIFCLGVVVMRSAGCVINDFADRKIDGKVARTQGRPLATGVISSREAIILFVTLCLIAFGLVLLTDPLTIKLSVGGLLLAFSYPFMKRHTHLPQVVLGAAFAWGIPMAYAAQTGALDKNMWLIYLAVVLWTVVYDTFYAMVDRDDDLKIGVKSTAILFGDQDRVITGALQLMVLYSLVLVGKAYALGWIFYLSLAVVTGLFAYQQWLIRFRERQACFTAFLNNNWVGAAVFVGIALDLALK